MGKKWGKMGKIWEKEGEKADLRRIWIKTELSLLVGDVIHAGLTSRAQDKEEDARSESAHRTQGTQGY